MRLPRGFRIGFLSISDRSWIDFESILGPFSYKSALTEKAKRLFLQVHLSCNKVDQEAQERIKIDTERVSKIAPNMWKHSTNKVEREKKREERREQRDDPNSN